MFAQKYNVQNSLDTYEIFFNTVHVDAGSAGKDEVGEDKNW